MLDFLNEDPIHHTLDVSIANSVSAVKVRQAQEAERGTLAHELQVMSAASHVEEEEKSRAFLEKELTSQRERALERERREAEDAEIAKRLAEQFAAETETASPSMSTPSTSTTTLAVDPLEAFFRDNPDARKEHEESQRRLKERTEQMKRDEEYAKKLRDEMKAQTSPRNSSVPRLRDRTRRRHSDERTKKKRNTKNKKRIREDTQKHLSFFSPENKRRRDDDREDSDAMVRVVEAVSVSRGK